MAKVTPPNYSLPISSRFLIWISKHLLQKAVDLWGPYKQITVVVTPSADLVWPKSAWPKETLEEYVRRRRLIAAAPATGSCGYPPGENSMAAHFQRQRDEFTRTQAS